MNECPFGNYQDITFRIVLRFATPPRTGSRRRLHSDRFLRAGSHPFARTLALGGSVKARLAASAALALGLVLGASGCSMLTYQATTEKYDASDGVSVDVGD